MKSGCFVLYWRRLIHYSWSCSSCEMNATLEYTRKIVTTINRLWVIIFITDTQPVTGPYDAVHIITGLPNGPVLFCSLASVVCRRRLSSSVRAGRRARERSGGRHCMAGQYGYAFPLGRHFVVLVLQATHIALYSTLPIVRQNYGGTWL